MVKVTKEWLKEIFDCILVKRFFAIKEVEEKAAIDRFFNDHTHGVLHSNYVFERCLDLMAACPNLCKSLLQEGTGDGRVDRVTTEDLILLSFVGSLFHDFGRSCDRHFSDHERFGANLARVILLSQGKHPWKSEMVEFMLVQHDYMGFVACVDQGIMAISRQYPLAELFRLADKTSFPPAAEVERYWQTARQYNMPLFDRTIPDEVRFDLVRNTDKRTDSLTWMLLLFAQQPSDFLFRETAAAFDRWHDKKVLLAKISEIAAVEGYDGDDIFATIRRFHDHHGLDLG